MASLRRFIFQDFGTKILALILALAVYVHVFSGREREMVYRIPLLLGPPPAGLSYTGAVPSEVRVRIRAPGRDLLRLRTHRFNAEINLDAAHAGTLQRPILGSDVKLPWPIRAASVEVLEPQTLELTLERSATVRLPVAVRTSGSLPANRALAAPPRAEPATVRASGPTSLLAAAESVATEPVPLAGIRGYHEQDCGLIAPPGVALEGGQVRVFLDAVEKRVRSTGRLRIQLLQPQRDIDRQVRPEYGVVLLSGPAAALDALDLRSIRLVADARRMDPRTRRVPLRPQVAGLAPHGMVTLRCDPESVTVEP